jgi:hypothetical protein
MINQWEMADYLLTLGLLEDYLLEEHPTLKDQGFRSLNTQQLLELKLTLPLK